ncbi:probable G-protein coupled receptor No18 isoform X2 [Acanthaster planci]|nr:probable G-protein coupled receptor No18 isoform X2 [Acanthaster planci]XP_022088775.1 probable G-protein coupled receptor No18 isoform X2 [Acanthaster planci]XP_022088787.1 probable G-protein coupled receptor No18 isoform X2 [Acanthaster planci]
MDSNSSASHVDYYSKHPVKDILIATFVPVFIVSLIGNLLVVYVIVRNRSMHTVTNFFLLNLAVSDLLVTLFCIIPTLLYFIQVNWSLGVFICKAHKATLTVTTTASIFMLTVISMERYIVILHPFHTKRILTVQRLIGVVVAVWLLSIVLSIPMCISYDVLPGYVEGMYCGATAEYIENGARIQFIAMLFVCYLVPLVIMLVLYTRIGWGLWTPSRTGDNSLSALPGPSGKKSKTYMKVTYKGNKAVSSVEEKSPVPPGEGLRIHIGRQISPPPGESTSAHSDSDDTPRKTLLRNCSSEPSRPINRGDVQEKIGPFFIDYPEETDIEQTETVESNNTAVLWRSCNDILLCSGGDKSASTRYEARGIETEKTGIDSNGIGSHQAMSKSENELNSHQITDEGNQSAPSGDGRGIADTDKENSQYLNPGRTYGGFKSRLGSKSEGDKRPANRKYEPAAASGQASPAYGRANPHALSRQCMKKTPSKRKRNAEAVMHARRKVIRLLVVMVVCFAVCLFPLQLISVWSLFAIFSDQSEGGALVTAFTYLAYFSNSAINPFLYAFLSDNFRSKMRETLLCISSRTRRQVSLRQMRLKSVTSDAFTESELMPS